MTETEFQSTRPRGARHPYVEFEIPSEAFQSTRPRGARLYSTLSRNAPSMFQSTRPRGARPLMASSFFLYSRRFNPRARVGRDLPPLLNTMLFCLFQSTRPRGARLSRLTRRHHRFCFNPRARVGRDL